VDLAVALVVGLARKPDDRPARDGITLAPSWLVSALGIAAVGIVLVGGALLHNSK